MISMAKSFDENIAAGNESYEKFCLQLINHGKIEDKFAALLSAIHLSAKAESILAKR